jgi:hypothetical protein
MACDEGVDPLGSGQRGWRVIRVYLNSKYHFGWDILHDEMGLKAAGGKLQGHGQAW